MEAHQGIKDEAALRELRGAYPHLRIQTEFYGTARVWVARGANGHPWLVASDDLARFRRALNEPQP